MIRVTASTGTPRGWTVYDHPTARHWYIDSDGNLVLTGEQGRWVATYADDHWSRVADDEDPKTPGDVIPKLTGDVPGREPEGHHDPEFWRNGPHEPA